MEKDSVLCAYVSKTLSFSLLAGDSSKRQQAVASSHHKKWPLPVCSDGPRPALLPSGHTNLAGPQGPLGFAHSWWLSPRAACRCWGPGFLRVTGGHWLRRSWGMWVKVYKQMEQNSQAKFRGKVSVGGLLSNGLDQWLSTGMPQKIFLKLILQEERLWILNSLWNFQRISKYCVLK